MLRRSSGLGGMGWVFFNPSVISIILLFRGLLESSSNNRGWASNIGPWTIGDRTGKRKWNSEVVDERMEYYVSFIHDRKMEYYVSQYGQAHYSPFNIQKFNPTLVSLTPVISCVQNTLRDSQNLWDTWQLLGHHSEMLEHIVGRLFFCSCPHSWSRWLPLPLEAWRVASL